MRVYFELLFEAIGKRYAIDMTSIRIRPLTPEDQNWAARLLTDNWGSTRVVSYGRVHEADHLPGVVAEVGGQRLGLATFGIEGSACEIVTLNALQQGLGIGTQLIDAVDAQAAQAGCDRLWLITTNDNLHALRFYQKRGFRLVELRCNEIERSRELKPEIPTIGQDGIPIRDELVLERDVEFTKGTGT
jgi:ribosomal protein S18 acetylase RimI-like enzyme